MRIASHPDGASLTDSVHLEPRKATLGAPIWRVNPRAAAFLACLFLAACGSEPKEHTPLLDLDVSTAMLQIRSFCPDEIEAPQAEYERELAATRQAVNHLIAADREGGYRPQVEKAKRILDECEPDLVERLDAEL